MLAKIFQKAGCDSVSVLGIATKCKLAQKGIVFNFCSLNNVEPSENVGKELPSAGSSNIGSDSSISSEGSVKEPALDMNTECSEMPRGKEHEDKLHADKSNDDYMKPRSRKERIRSCLAKLKKGPDGRFINVLEVATDVDMLIAAYQNLKARSKPSYLLDGSDDDDNEDKLLEGIEIERFKKLQKRLRSGTYKFQPVRTPSETKTKKK